MDKLWQITEGLNRRFPDGNDPFQIMTRLLEECRELVQQVNHFEGGGIKRQKYGEPDKQKMAKEVMDVLGGALQIALYYDIRPELEATLEKSYLALKKEGFISAE